jgi:hypothetical protein
VAGWAERERSEKRAGNGQGAEARAGWLGCELERDERKGGGEEAVVRIAAVSEMRRAGSHNPGDLVKKGCGA